MARKKGKKSTPAELDFIFQRKLIEEDEYRDFWPRWWKANENEQEEIIEEYLERTETTPLGNGDSPLRGIVTKDKKVAEKQARIIHGWVVKRNSHGQFSKRGHFYQAIQNKRRKK